MIKNFEFDDRGALLEGHSRAENEKKNLASVYAHHVELNEKLKIAVEALVLVRSLVNEVSEIKNQNARWLTITDAYEKAKAYLEKLGK